jgi:hypothetical protein
MKNNKFAIQILVFGLIIGSFIACDKDFATLESDVINNDNATNFDILSEQYDIVTYTKALGPVQTNGLAINTLGIYDDVYGRTTSSFVTQVTPSSYDPDFGEEVVIDSVVLTLPFFNASTEIEENGNILYDIDSVIGREPMRLRLFESNYFIRDFDPNADFNESQAYFSNKSASATETISEAALEGEELGFVDFNEQTGEFDVIDNIITISDQGYVLTNPNELDEDGNAVILQRQQPGIRILLDRTFWQNKIIDQEGQAVLSNESNFADYFRGLYFKVEPVNNDGSFLMLNIGAQASNITIYYTRLNSSATEDDPPTEQVTFELRFGLNRINFMENSFTTPITDGNDLDGDSRLYLKGGEGSIANIKLFNGDDINDGDDNTFDNWKSLFVETDSDGNFVKSKRLINEANLVFYVDQEIVQDSEPNRIYLYDIENKSPLTDYYRDSDIPSLPSFSRINHLGPLERVDDEPTGNGIKYKLKITEHINNLLIRDSTNVELGLAVSTNVNLEEFSAQRKVQSSVNPDLTAPVSSILTPRGTILHGNTTEDESKRVYLEIYYTEPNN